MLGGAEAKAHLNVHGHDNTRRAFSSIRKNITGFNSELKNTAISFAGAFGVKQIVDMADSITDLKNRLNSFNNDTTKTAKQMDLIGQVALKTRASFEATGVVFTRMIQATQHLGITSEELAAATATVNATFKLSGTTAYEAANSARQLAQGLSSGRLSGDEMRSVLENNVVLANLLADGFGVTVGQLRELGAAGKVTTEKIMPILIDSFQETTDKVSNMEFTIDAAFTLLQTRLFETVRKFNDFTGATSMVASGIAFLAENFTSVALTIFGALIPALTAATFGIIRMLGAAIALALANPITLFVTASAAALGYLVSISNTAAANLYNSFGQFFAVTIPNQITKMQIAFQYFLLYIAGNWKQAIFDELNGVGEFLNDLANRFREFAGFEKVAYEPFAIDTTETMNKINELEREIINRGLDFKLMTPEDFEGFAEFLDILDPKKIADKIAGTTKEVNVFMNDLEKSVEEFFAKQQSVGQQMGKLITDSFKKFTDTITDFVMQGKASFADLFRFIRQELVRLYVQEKITTPLFTALGLKKKQGGGQVVGGTPYMVGEKGAELFIPSTSGNIISASDLKNAAKSSPTAEPINVNFTIQATDASGFDELLSSRKNQIVAMISQAMNQKGKVGLI